MSDQYIFWDLETTGRDDKYNQITQVGAILTDSKFEIKDKLEIHSKLREGKWFEPGALITTGVDPLNLFKNNYPNYYEACSQLYETFQEWSSPSTIFIGFNNIQFDEKHLRQAFYQNLMPDIYMTVLNNNYRMDVLDILRLVSVYSPEHIKFDTTEKGNPSLSLENISKKNNITTNYEAGPHDAVYDSLITLELIKMLSIRCPQIWKSAYEFRHRDTPKKFMLDNLVFTNTTFYGKAFIKAQTSIAGIPGEKHKYLVFNLLYDPKKFHKLEEKDLAKKMIGTDRICDVFDGSKSKVLLNESYCFKDNKYAEIGVDELRSRANFIKNNEEFCSRLVKLYLETKKTYSDPITVEERIFENFPSNQDKKLMIDFHTSPNKNKFNIANQFKDDRYKEIAIRIVYEIARDTLSDKDKRNYEFEIRERFNDDDTVYWNSKNKILASFEKDKKLKEKLNNMNENERNEFKQKIITFLNNESAKWS
tara:strand:- start:4243 stop:5676 length:1434 start_codon:yes stop_codon:yes gene_type:complete